MPRLSIVIPVLGRYEELAQAVERLQQQTCESGLYELVVVSDAAEPDPARIKEVIGRRPFEARHVSAPIPGAASARDTGWRDAAGPQILFIDSDVLASPNLVRGHLSWHDANPEDEVAVLGPVRWATNARVSGFMRWVEKLHFNYHTISGVEAGWGHFITANVSVKRKMLERVDGFDVEAFPFHYEDLEIAYRMREHGLRVLFNRDASAEHLHAVTLDQYRRRIAEVAPAERRFVQRHPDVEPFFYNLFSDAIRAPASRGGFGRLLGLVSPSAPLIGQRVWRSADAYYRQQLAPAFLDAWAAADGGAEDAGDG
jgi:glycosyltransferase involved in cell wall biosynthesis